MSTTTRAVIDGIPYDLDLKPADWMPTSHVGAVPIKPMACKLGLVWMIGDTNIGSVDEAMAHLQATSC